jgi:hypothetical protein
VSVGEKLKNLGNERYAVQGSGGGAHRVAGNHDRHRFKCPQAGMMMEIHDEVFSHLARYCWSRDSSVGIATGYGLDDRGVRSSSPGTGRIIPSPGRPKGAEGSFSVVKRSEREADLSPPTSD